MNKNYIYSTIVLHVPFAMQEIVITAEDEAKEAAERLKFFFAKEVIKVDVQLLHYFDNGRDIFNPKFEITHEEVKL